jgi:hypothetical protein
MELTLRKANAVQVAINDAIKALPLTTEITINEFEDVETQINVARDRFWENSSTREKLVAALFDIRAKVAQANASSSINDMLTSAAAIEKQIGFNSTMASKGPQVPLPVLVGQIKKNANSKDDGFGYNSRPVNTSIFTEAEIEDFKRNAALLKKVKQQIQDKLLELNIHTKIELETRTVEILEKVGIL